MSINDPVRIAPYKEEGYVLLRGRETFYDKDDYLRVFSSPEEARQWAIKNLDVDPMAEEPFEEKIKRSK